MKIRAIVRLKHGAIMKALDERGWRQSDLARAAGISPQDVGKVCNLNFQTSQKVIKAIADALDMDEDDVVPREFMDKRLVNIFSSDKTVQNNMLTAMSRQDMRRIAPDPSRTFDASDLTESISRAMQDANLKEREKLSLRLRFGIGCEHPHTLREISNVLGVSCERVRQIEQSGLEKLREHPHITKLIESIVSP